MARPTPVHKRRRFVGLVKDAKSNQIGMETAAIWGMLVKIAKAIGVGAQKAALTLKRHARGDFSPESWVERPRKPFHPALTLSPSKPVSLQALLDGWAAEKQPTQKTVYSWKRVLEQLGLKVFGDHEPNQPTIERPSDASAKPA